MLVIRKLAAPVLISSALVLSISAAHAISLSFGGGPVNAPPFPGYGTDVKQNNVVNNTASHVTDNSAAPGGGTMIGTISGSPAVATVTGAPASGYQIDWYFIGAESGYQVTLNVPTLSGYSETNQNNQCGSSCGPVPSSQIGPQFIGTSSHLATETVLNFSLSAKDGAIDKGTLANGSSNPTPGGHPTPTSTAASLVFSFAELTGGNPLNQDPANKFWELVGSLVYDSNDGIWFLFAFNDTGGPDDNHDDFVGMARIYASGPNEQTDVPVPAALPLFGTGLGALGLLAWRRKRKAAA